jgi:hypothetical protein
MAPAVNYMGIEPLGDIAIKRLLQQRPLPREFIVWLVSAHDLAFSRTSGRRRPCC